MDRSALIIDGGDRACVKLLLEVRARLAAMPAGSLVHLIATDPAAPIDIPAWCHLTGHEYLGPVTVPGDPRAAYGLRVAAAARPTDPRSPWRPA